MELSVMTRFVAFIIVVSVTNAREPKCTIPQSFQYQEHLLAKLIRMEIKFETKIENLLNKVTEMQQNVNTGLDSLTLDRNNLAQELATMMRIQEETLNRTVDETRMQEETLNRTVDETSALMKRVLRQEESLNRTVDETRMQEETLNRTVDETSALMKRVLGQEESLNRNVNETSALMKRALGDMEDKMKELENEIATKRSDVKSAFSVSSPFVFTSGKLTFSITHYNSGGDYSVSTGIFTCSKPGVYQFSVSLTKKRASTRVDAVFCYLYKNSGSVLRIYIDPTDDDTDKGSASVSNSALLDLNSGDTVSLQECSDPPSKYMESWSSFTGFLLYPDL